MEGISKGTLLKLLDGNHEYKMSNPYINAQRKILIALIGHCKELDPWLPIDENTPKDRHILIMVEGVVVEAYWSTYHWVSDFPNYSGGVYGLQPTHWKELPEDPK